MKSVVVFCGSGSGTGKEYLETAFEVGRILAAQHIRIIYGGSRTGLMGALADGALSEQGEVVGVLPAFLLTKEIAHEGLSELIIVQTMHERKLRMHELSDGIITLPGGFGTMEELFEMLTWAQLGLHQKPIGLLNTQGFYNCLQQLVDTMVHQDFLSTRNADMLLIEEDIHALLYAMNRYVAPEMPEWISKQTT